MAPTDHPRQVALYHPWPHLSRRRVSGWLKTMLLFFDGVALLAPPEAIDTLEPEDRTTARSLLEAGLFFPVDPCKLMDRDAADRIMTFLLQASSSLQGRIQYGFTGPLRSRVKLRLLDAFEINETREEVLEYSKAIWHELFVRGLALDAKASYPSLLDPSIWNTVEGLLAYTLQPVGIDLGLDFHLTTNDPRFLNSAMRILGGTLNTSSAHMIESNLEGVAPDLSAAPLDEVLEFREYHGERYRRYMEHLRLSAIDFPSENKLEQKAGIADRNAELIEEAADLRRIIRQRWRYPVPTIGVGIVGAEWTSDINHDEPTSLPLFSGSMSAEGSGRDTLYVYSYLFKTCWSLIP
jgi:hypothetical protein